MKLIASGTLLLLLLMNVLSDTRTPHEQTASPKILLRDDWRIQSSAKIKANGGELSQASFKPRGWYPTSIPSTVFGALVANKVYPDPYFGMNLRAVPGCNYPIGSNFSNLPMPEDSPYRVSWWYRTSFRLPQTERGENLWLHFDGINFRANIWLNGKQIATSQDVAGAYRRYEFNVTEAARVNEVNTLAVEVFPPQVDDLALTWVDWNPMPPDKNMGLWHDVYVTSSGPVALRSPQVITHFDSNALDVAHLTVNAEVRNATNDVVTGTLRGRIEEAQFAQQVTLQPNETKQVAFTPNAFPQLNIKNPRLWWPVNMGPQNLYDLALQFETNNQISDKQTTRFGIREVTSEINDDNHRVFKVNGRNVLVRGGGWAFDMLRRRLPEKLEHEIQYVRDMNLNAIRLEGNLESDEFYELTDRYGILVMAGWCCCDHWEHWQHRDDYKEGPIWDAEDYKVAAASLADQTKRLRNHPSVFVWLNGSDNPPPADVEQLYIDTLKRYQWPNPYISSATAKRTIITGASGVKMEGPYEWVPPVYWLQDTQHGGAHGFATEISPGPAVPPVESLRKMLPKDRLWPINDYWNYHAGGGQFKTLNVFNAAMNARYGEAKTLEDYTTKAQLMAYEGQRAMFEGYARNRYTSGGVIQWMLNNAWPSLIWHLYDYYLMPGGGYFGTKKACEPVHAQYSYDDKSIVVVNNTSQSLKNLRLTARVFDTNAVERFSKTINLNVKADANEKTFALPEMSDMTPVYFLKLTLADTDEHLISENLYWLATKDDTLDWQKTTWYYTPVQSYADLTSLNTLKAVNLRASGNTTRQGDDETAHVTIENPTRALAFFVRLQIKRDHSDEDILPVIWQDNYITLLPGEKRTLTATYKIKDAQSRTPTLVVSGWNVPAQNQKLAQAAHTTR